MSLEAPRCANTGHTYRNIRARDNGVPYEKQWVYRRPMTIEEAERGDLPKPFSAEEWRAMANAAAKLDKPIRRS
jgi:hypothetical protein